MPAEPFATSPGVLVAVGVCAYLLGAVPFGVVMARLFGLGDLRAVGSRSIGATNVLRTGHRLAAFLTLLLDAGKGGVAVLVVRHWGLDAAALAGFAACVGHCFPVYLGFRGGKGVATFLGTLVCLSWPVGVATCASWLAIAALFRISSLASLGAAALSGVWALGLGEGRVAVVCVLLAVLIGVRHHENVRRLVRGREPKIGRT